MTHEAMERGWILSEPAHDDTYPVVISKREFTGEIKKATGVLGGEPMSAARAKQMEATKTLLAEVPSHDPDEPYRIYHGRYSIHPQTNAKWIEQHGNVAVTTFYGVSVGVAMKRFLWVHPEHIGHRIGVEMAIALFVYWGLDRFMNDGPGFHNMEWTPDGLKMLERQYRYMVERGIVAPPEET